MNLGRSLLFLPANRERFWDKAASLAVDGFVVDLEDGVPIAEKGTGRAMTRERIGGLGRPAWVRVNGTESGELDADLEALVGLGGLDGVMLPKVGSAAEITALAARLASLEAARNVADGTTRIIAQIESAAGVLNAFAIATASSRMASLCFASARDGDLQVDLGAAWSIDGPELMYARQHALLAARAAGMSWPLDGVFADVSDADGFERDTTLSRRLGYRGRTVIHPGQIEPANRLYAPAAAELDEARRVIEAFAAAEAEGRATTVLDGRLIDYAMVRRARDVLAIGALFGASGGEAASS